MKIKVTYWKCCFTFKWIEHSRTCSFRKANLPLCVRGQCSRSHCLAYQWWESSVPGMDQRQYTRLTDLFLISILHYRKAFSLLHYPSLLHRLSLVSFAKIILSEFVFLSFVCLFGSHQPISHIVMSTKLYAYVFYFSL